MTISLHCAASQIQGNRASQQDSYGLRYWDAPSGSVPTLVAVLCDGMGGHKDGQLASQLASHAYLAALETNPAKLQLSVALQSANQAIASNAFNSRAGQSMGTTLLGIRILNNVLEWISVGDTSLLLHRDGLLRRLNADHSMHPVLAKMVAIGELSAEDAAKDPKRHMLRSSLSGTTIRLIDQPARPLVLQPGDQLLLATDGIDALSHNHLEGLLERHQQHSLEQLVTNLLSAIECQQVKHQDNATAIAIRVGIAGNS